MCLFQWTTRASSPRLALAAAETPAEKGTFKLVQDGDPFELPVPLRVKTISGESHEMKVRVRDKVTVVDPVSASSAILAGAKEVELDPDLRLWRRLEPQAVPPIFREVFI